MAAELVETLRVTLSNDNASRDAAEKKFQQAKISQPTQTIAALLQALAQQQLEEPVREQAAVLLRQCLTKISKEGSAWSKLDEAARSECKAGLLQLLEGEQQGKVRRKLADIVQKLGNQLIHDDDEDTPPSFAQSWPELMPTLLRIITDATKPAGLRADALLAARHLLVKELFAASWTVNVAKDVLKLCIIDASMDVRAQAASLLCELIDNVKEKETRSIFAPLIPDLVNTIKCLADLADDQHIKVVLQSMQATAESADFFWDAFTSQMMSLLCVVGKSHNAEDVQRLAMEAIISFAEAKPKAFSKAPSLVQQTLDLCAKFLMQLEDDLQGWAEQDDDEADEEDNFANGKEVVDRLCRCMHKADKFGDVLEILRPAIAALFQSPDWKQVVAGAAILTQIVEYVEDEEAINVMVTVVRGKLMADNVRIRHAAWSAIGQFSQDHSETMVNDSLAPQLLPDFLQGFNDPCARVQSRCMEAFQLFGSELDRELLQPVVQPMMERLAHWLQTSPRPIQRKVITCIAVVAGQVQDGFAPYYGSLMPILKQVIQATLHSVEERTLLGKAFECISLFARAKPDCFQADAEVIMEAMVQATQVPNLPNNDPVQEYMLQASQRICATMKGGFLRFVPHILPGILQKFSLAPKEYSPEGVEKDFDSDAEVNLTMTQDKDGKVKLLIMGTAEMEELKNALMCVRTFVEELGALYNPFIAQTAQGLLPVFEFSMEEEIRDLAFETWGQLCNVTRQEGQTQVLTELLHGFLGRVLPKFGSASQEADNDAEALKTRADGVTTCLKKAGSGVLSQEQVGHICQVALKTLSDSLKRREEELSLLQKATSKKAKSVEDEEASEDEDDEDEANLRIACCEMVGALMEHHPDAFMAESFTVVFPVVQRFFQQTVGWEDRRLALFIVCDFIVHLGPRAKAQWPQFIPQMLQDVTHQSPSIRQPACYGVSLVAKDPDFAPFAADTAGKLAQLVAHSRSKGKKKSQRPEQACADNALSALMEILRHQQQATASMQGQLWHAWLQGLPCQLDDEEGVKNHKVLLQMVECEQPQVLGAAGENLPQVLSILVDVYRTEMADEATSKGIGQLVLKLGEQRLEQLVSQLKEKQRKKLVRIHREAQQGA